MWNYHGEDVEISQDNTNISVPMVVSSRGYGIFWNNPSRSRFNNRFPHAFYLSSEVADTVDYYFLFGPEFDHIVASYRELTGEPRRSLENGRTVSGSARINTTRRMKCWAWRKSTAT